LDCSSEDGSNEQALSQHILHSGVAGISIGDLLNRVAMAPDELQAMLKR
jgi:hypothetical protein